MNKFGSHIYIILFILILFSCSDKNETPCQLNKKDSILNKEIEKIIDDDDLTQAENLLKNRIEKGPTKQVFLNNLGAVLLKKYNRNEAHQFEQLDSILEIFTRANELCPNRKPTIGNIVETYHSYNKYHKTIEFSEKYLGLFSPSSAVFSRLSDSYRELDRPDKSLEYAELAIELDSTCQFCHYLKGEALNQQNQYEKALKSYQESLKLDPEDVLTIYSIGRLFHKMNRKEMALEYYLQVYDMEPDDKLNLIAIGNIYSDFGKKILACKYYDQTHEKPCNWCTPRELEYWNEKKPIIKKYCE